MRGPVRVVVVERDVGQCWWNEKESWVIITRGHTWSLSLIGKPLNSQLHSTLDEKFSPSLFERNPTNKIYGVINGNAAPIWTIKEPLIPQALRTNKISQTSPISNPLSMIPIFFVVASYKPASPISHLHAVLLFFNRCIRPSLFTDGLRFNDCNYSVLPVRNRWVGVCQSPC